MFADATYSTANDTSSNNSYSYEQKAMLAATYCDSADFTATKHADALASLVSVCSSSNVDFSHRIATTVLVEATRKISSANNLCITAASSLKPHAQVAYAWSGSSKCNGHNICSNTP